jgi:hypothetical protein
MERDSVTAEPISYLAHPVESYGRRLPSPALRLPLGPCGIGHEQAHLARSLEARLDIIPVPGIPDRLEKRGLLVLVLKVVGVLLGYDPG